MIRLYTNKAQAFNQLNKIILLDKDNLYKDLTLNLKHASQVSLKKHNFMTANNKENYFKWQAINSYE